MSERPDELLAVAPGGPSRREFLQALVASLMVAGASGAGCGDADGDPPSDPVEDAIDALVAELTLEEKVRLVSGAPLSLASIANVLVDYNAEPIVTGDLPERGVESIRFSDGPRGVVMFESTCFPVSMSRAASFDPDLERRIGDAIGVEARTQGANLFAGICVNLLRHPGWGRAQECYGEDPVVTAAMGVALLEGAQRHVMGCIKHFALNSIEDSRFRVDVRADPRAMHEVYLPHFKACVDAGVASVMSAYNRVNGEFCGQNRPLLTEILKERWGFDGFVLSDFVLGIRDGAAAMNAGLDLEMPLTLQFGERLARAVEAGEVPEERLDDACRRIIRKLRRFEDVGEPARYVPEAVVSAAHVDLAREAAADGMVLLRNEPAGAGEGPLLPLDPTGLARVAVVGRLIETPNLGDEGSSQVRPPYVVTPLEGVRRALPQARVDAIEGATVEGSEDAIAAADVVVALVGFTHEDEGENIFVKGGDRRQLGLRPEDEDLLLSLVALNPRTVAVAIAGRAGVSEAWRGEVPAILLAWYPGMEGGNAIADVLTGARSPGGKLPCVFPVREADLPEFDPDADSAVYGLYHGHRHLDRNGVSPAFAFGFGLGYTSFELGPPTLASDTLGAGDELVVRVPVRNVGPRPGSEVVQAYVSAPGVVAERAPRELVAFRKVRLPAGGQEALEIRVPVVSFAYFDVASDAFAVEPGGHVLHVGTSSRPEDLVPVPFTVV